MARYDADGGRCRGPCSRLPPSTARSGRAPQLRLTAFYPAARSLRNWLQALLTALRQVISMTYPARHALKKHDTRSSRTVPSAGKPRVKNHPLVLGVVALAKCRRGSFDTHGKLSSSLPSLEWKVMIGDHHRGNWPFYISRADASCGAKQGDKREDFHFSHSLRLQL